jgi:hypothetical protein
MSCEVSLYLRITIFRRTQQNRQNPAFPAVTSVNPHKSERYWEMGKTIRASVLMLLLACSARAGYMQNDVKQPPPDATQAATADSQIQNDASASLAETVLSVLESLLSLL